MARHSIDIREGLVESKLFRMVVDTDWRLLKGSERYVSPSLVFIEDISLMKNNPLQKIDVLRFRQHGKFHKKYDLLQGIEEGSFEWAVIYSICEYLLWVKKPPTLRIVSKKIRQVQGKELIEVCINTKPINVGIESSQDLMFKFVVFNLNSSMVSSNSIWYSYNSLVFKYLIESGNYDKEVTSFDNIMESVELKT